MTSELDERKEGGRRGGDGPAEGRSGTGGLTLLPVIQKESDHPCFECAKCCTYVAIEIDRPTTMKEYDHVVWYLYHEGVSVFVDWEGDWYVNFESRCRNLTPQGLCGIYERRPAICVDFDWRECENHLKDEPPDKWLFRGVDEFMAWFERQRPRTFQRYQRFLRERHAGGTEPELARVKPGRAPRGARPLPRPEP